MSRGIYGDQRVAV